MNHQRRETAAGDSPRRNSRSQISMLTTHMTREPKGYPKLGRSILFP